MLRHKLKYILNMEKEHKIGMMEQNMKEIGVMEWQKEKVYFIMLMVIFIQENSIKIEQMDLVNMCIKMDKNTKDFGKMICKMVPVRKS